MAEFIVGDVASGAAAGTAISPGVGTIIGAGLGMLGGLFGSRSKPAKPVYDDKRFQRAAKDAKLAGLHPLFALGAGGAGSPAFMAGQSESGSRIGDVLKHAAKGVTDYSRLPRTNALQTKMATLQIQNAEVNLRKNLIDEQLMHSQLAREMQASNSRGHDASYTLPKATGTMADVTAEAGKVEITPTKTMTKTPGSPETVSGIHGMFQKYQYADAPGGYLWLPQSDEGPVESLQGLSPALWAVIILKNGWESAKYAYRLAGKSVPSMAEITKWLKKYGYKGQPAQTYPLMP